MKIDQPTTALPSIPGANNTNKPGILRTDDNAVNVSTLPANLDSTATHIQQLQTQLLQPSDADFNVAKVAEIRLAISEGRYQINADKIADGLIADVRDLLSNALESK